ncbi:MAG: hypothetical protein A2Y08_04745 [Planctomycetes bacterium GWA2_40_7]|nr:MAG: hypothetical protein A2Y08_04745 [Planctomycetes bacterium GWA2_40_7]
MTNKEIEKQNFILWYSLYATGKELEMARANNTETLNRLLKEYAEEIDKIGKARRFYERIIQPASRQTQGFDAALEINHISNERRGTVLAEVC